MLFADKFSKLTGISIRRENGMQREIHKWFSPNIEKEMETAVYGYYGYALLMFPTADSDFLEYEQNHLIDCIAGFINNGTLKTFTINGINKDSWLNRDIAAPEK